MQEISRKKPIIKNRVPEYIEKAVTDLAIEFPAFGQLRASNELRLKGILIFLKKKKLNFIEFLRIEELNIVESLKIMLISFILVLKILITL